MSKDNIQEFIGRHYDDVSKARLARMEKVYSGDLDSTFNFRCNGELKEDFNQLCKVNQTNPTNALKAYMLACLRSDKLL
ncbi:hypothetical protein [Vibrio scophthalmi]|uniref:Uncharacterized protein n=1 Tax=Vibrio scophthalmi LMG 19158 TaxID=870967 RepID=F9RPX9_9VIBR|nr:hypothetical protein [Vibrio scophthalmi]EGU34931.1 hypothetical protein VIS19158_10834 [Vibrio scophthalmi LMG 19158]